MEFVSFDIETTGILSHMDRIVEIGAVRFVNGDVKEKYQQLVSIGTPIPKEATAINGITDKMLEQQPPIEDVLPDFSDFCGNSLMVAHNAPFDFQFLLRALEESRSPVPRGIVLDTCQLARRSFPGLANYKLSTLCDYLKIPANDFHRAESDAFYCGHLFVHILKKNSFSVNDVQEIIKFSGRSALKFPYSEWEGQLEFFD